jgi:hypothetical protein
MAGISRPRALAVLRLMISSPPADHERHADAALPIQDVFDFNNAGLMGTERADDVTPGGDREFGQFGQEQSDFVVLLTSDDNPFPGQSHYGEWLQGFFFI